MPEIASEPRLDTPENIGAAVSLLNDWGSFKTRLGAAAFLASNPGFEDSAIQRIWHSVYTDKAPDVVAQLITTLGNIKERAADSVPLIAYHLHEEETHVVEAATRALCNLSAVVEHAWIPLLTANLSGAAEAIRDQHLCECRDAGNHQLSLYEEQLRWICGTPRPERALWLNELPRTGISSLTEQERARFLLLYADPTGEHVWGCLKVILQSQKTATHALAEQVERAISACEGSFFREVVSYGEPIRARFLAKALAHSRPFTASLAYPLANVDLYNAQSLTVRINATAVQLAPRMPPIKSLQTVLDGLWYENEGDIQACAIDCLMDLMPELGDESARHVIDDVFEFLREPAIKTHSAMRDVASITTTASNSLIPYILRQTQRLVSSQAPKRSKTCALLNVANLGYSGSEDPYSRDAKALLGRAAQHEDRGISNVARIALTRLLTCERSRIQGTPS